MNECSQHEEENMCKVQKHKPREDVTFPGLNNVAKEVFVLLYSVSGQRQWTIKLHYVYYIMH